MKHIKTIQNLSFIILICVNLNAASFDCQKILTKIEKTICNNSELNLIDVEMSTQYRLTIDSFPELGRTALIQDQRKWIHKRNQCLTEQCLITEYKKRINELLRYQKYLDLSEDQLNGRYDYNNGKRTSYISLKALGVSNDTNKKYLVLATSFYDINNKYGPNIGRISFIANIKNNKINWKKGDYKISLEINGNQIKVNEKGIPPSVGWNVFFKGIYG